MTGAPRMPLAGRYSFLALLRTSQGPRRWLATEAESGRPVVLAVLEPGRLGMVEAARGVRQRHISAILDVVRDVEADALPEDVMVPAGGAVVVAEFVAGRSVRDQLDSAAVNPTKAVAWTLRLAESLQALHAAGAVHGAISPRSVIGEPEGRKLPPVLSQLVIPAIGAYCPPERLKGAAEAASDDVWALHAFLYAALTREPPFRSDTRDALIRQMLTGKPKPLAAFGLDEPVLQEILARGLVGEKRLRVSELSELSKSLDDWERDPSAMPPKRATAGLPAPRSFAEIVGTGLGAGREDGIVIDGDSLADDEGRELKPIAPPLGGLPEAVPPQSPDVPEGASSGAFPRAPSDSQTTAAAAAQPLKRPSINPFERKKTMWPLLVAAALAGGGGVYLTLDPGAPKKEAAEPSPAPVFVPPAAPKAPEKKRNAREELNACVASYFVPGAFQGEPDFSFVCEGELREIAIKLHDMVPLDASGAGSAEGGAAAPPQAQDAGVRGAGLGWYELPATAIIRKHCCVGSTPILPETPGWCEQLQNAVKRIADDSQGAGDLAPAARAFDKAVNCLFANKVARPYVYEKPPNEANRRAFQQFLGRAAVSEARR